MSKDDYEYIPLTKEIINENGQTDVVCTLTNTYGCCVHNDCECCVAFKAILKQLIV